MDGLLGLGAPRFVSCVVSPQPFKAFRCIMWFREFLSNQVMLGSDFGPDRSTIKTNGC